MTNPTFVDSLGNSYTFPINSDPSSGTLQSAGNTSLSTIATAVATLALHSDIVTSNNSLATIATNTAGLALHSDIVATNTALGTVNTTLALLATHVDATATNTALSTINTSTLAGNTLLGTLATHTDVTATNTALGTANTTLALLATHTDLVTANTNLVQLHTDNGAPATGIAQPTGGSGTLGWLSGLYSKLILPASLGKTLSANSLAVVLASDPDTRPGAGTITVVDTLTTTTAGMNGVTVVTGAPTTSSFLAWAVNGQNSANFSISGTFVATIIAEGSYDNGTTYVSLSCRIRGTGYTVSSITGIGSFAADIAGMTNIRLRATSFTSGSFAAYPTFSASPGLTQILNPVRLFDNTSGVQASIKAGSTLPLSTDTAMVITARDVIKTEIVDASGNPLDYTVAATTNITQIAGATISQGHGTAAGAIRVELPSDGTGVVGLVTGTQVAAVGLSAAGTAYSLNPLPQGGLAKTANPSAVADGQVVNQLHDKLGKLIAVSAIRALKGKQSTALTNTSSTSIIAAPGASVYRDIFRLQISNSYSTVVVINISDGTVSFPFVVPAGATSGFAGDAGSAMVASSTATGWTATLVTAGAVNAVNILAEYVDNL